MPRKAKPVDLATVRISTKEKEARREYENKLRGGNDKLEAPSYLNSRQKEIFEDVKKELELFVGNVDIFILCEFAIATERLEVIETLINSDAENLNNKALLTAKNTYTKSFFKCISELSLSPGSRSKLANINAKVESDKDDPLLALINRD